MVANRETWLAERRQFVTGSWLAPILGIASPAGTALDAWAWFVHGYSREETELMRIGREMEPTILKLFSAAHDGAHVAKWPAFRLAGARPGRIWAATLDGLTAAGLAEGLADASELDGWRRDWKANLAFLEAVALRWGIPVEAKNVGWAWRDWADGPPPHVVAQVQVQIDAIGAPFGYVAAMLQGCEFKWWRVPRREAFIRDAKLRCRRWWARHVEGGEMPAVDGRKETSQLLAKLGQPQQIREAVALPPPAAEIRKQLAIARETRRMADLLATLRANELRALMGRNAYGVCPDDKVVSHKGGVLRLPKVLPYNVEPPNPWTSGHAP